ncbi:M28 family metallopeptidase [Candidatus Chrysopegis kryptomonas]|uniref:N-acetylated-alpha-linked acidic dipeptidase n=1 Tax=Candidatus Chryseopegocella kryptomonas TaxID=1633643 RepID=A0A0P1MXZ0_9BACT|nr:M28 family metallopeptidase [Candidatus Chrysopegis kryptomonas]CUT01031.1 N-acetylated-alpha-linked acidic dipeptidase [Candidatus Chrysopegis kryptomonas]
MKRVSFLLVFISFVIQAQNLTGFLGENTQRQIEWEKKFLSIPKSQNCERHLFILTEEPHPAGSEAGYKVAFYIDSVFKSYGLNSKIVDYWAYLPYPEEVVLEMTQPSRIKFDLKETSWLWDKDTYDDNIFTFFNAYSPDGEVEAQVVYVNYGLPEDYEKLKELGIDVRGKIVMARYGKSFRGVKAKVAEENGAIGLIIYSDPMDDGYMKGDVYPRGPWRPEGAVQRGSIYYMFEYPGDPLTPGYPATKDAKRISPEQAKSLPKVPTMPVSYGIAKVILENLSGPVVPEEWQGGLPFAYHTGPGPAKVKMKIKSNWKIRQIKNVVAELRGFEEPEKKIIFGNHHDAWVYGAVDPNSGTAVMLETARALSELVKSGWRPKRSIVFCAWDAEEYGLIGSTEWVEDNYNDLVKNAIAYINVDVAVSGKNFGASAVPSLDRFIEEVIKSVDDPETGNSIFVEAWKNQNKNSSSNPPDTARIKIGRLGSGSDYTAFLDYAGIPSIDMRFTGPYGVYHSQLDNFYWMKNFCDPTFKYHETMCKIVGIALMRLSSADYLPFNYVDYADEVEKYVNQIEKNYGAKLKSNGIDFASVKEKLKLFKIYADSLFRIRNSLVKIELQKIEQKFTRKSGLPNRDWYKHRIYAPGYYLGYGSQPLPGISEMLYSGNFDAVKREIKLLEEAIEDVIKEMQTILKNKREVK